MIVNDIELPRKTVVKCELIGNHMGYIYIYIYIYFNYDIIILLCTFKILPFFSIFSPSSTYMYIPKYIPNSDVLCLGPTGKIFEIRVL